MPRTWTRATEMFRRPSASKETRFKKCSYISSRENVNSLSEDNHREFLLISNKLTHLALTTWFIDCQSTTWRTLCVDDSRSSRCQIKRFLLRGFRCFTKLIENKFSLDIGFVLSVTPWHQKLRSREMRRESNFRAKCFLKYLLFEREWWKKFLSWTLMGKFLAPFVLISLQKTQRHFPRARILFFACYPLDLQYLHFNPIFRFI